MQRYTWKQAAESDKYAKLRSTMHALYYENVIFRMIWYMKIRSKFCAMAFSATGIKRRSVQIFFCYDLYTMSRYDRGDVVPDRNHVTAFVGWEAGHSIIQPIRETGTESLLMRLEVVWNHDSDHGSLRCRGNCSGCIDLYRRMLTGPSGARYVKPFLFCLKECGERCARLNVRRHSGVKEPANARRKGVREPAWLFFGGESFWCSYCWID